MRTLLALIATVLACALARPLVPSEDTPPVRPGQARNHGPPKYISDYILPRLLLPRFEGYDESLNPVPPESEVDHLEDMDIMDGIPMQETELSPYYYGYVPGWIPESRRVYMKNILADSTNSKFTTRAPSNDYFKSIYRHISSKPELSAIDTESKNFALSPLNKNYYINKVTSVAPTQEIDVSENQNLNVIEQRKTRQNPNWSKQKSLIAENLDRLRTGFTQEDVEGTDSPKHIHVLETPPADPAESIYGVALIAAAGLAFTMAFIGLAFGWYTLSKKAKAAADVDYPAYGVTGPTVDASGDRKLAQSAHMYHYQHQKQQIIAMERNGMEQRNGSVSDPESEEENEEGDYTVYECPGFATTGDMEVKNPLFKEDSTPANAAIPAKLEPAKSQPKE
ncbi:uncharacterized protein LOC116777314 isoform X2 [Danaus plexippus]|uniref:uncharacterized protein LOC116777314 isoform X2 n=1 Tax=Danaus plexippus TaxID=13037 RepID=UPI002AAF7956|nr:uncharacterized protein LOC116777314 isoform X2 [Danaus plexippus]